MTNPMITFHSLLKEMTNLQSLVEFPDPYYTGKQFSSYDRRSTTPDDNRNWFANKDWGEFIRLEEQEGRQEWVIMDHQGPGCVTRIWAPNHDDFYNKEEEISEPVGWIMRIYLDGQAQPVIEADMVEFINGRSFVKEPLSYTSLRSGVLYMPIPYAQSCKITLDKVPFFYLINYRSYVAEANVQTFTLDHFHNERTLLEQIGQQLLHPVSSSQGNTFEMTRLLQASDRATLDLLPGPAAIKELEIQIKAEQLDEALRATVLIMNFDGEETVWCPIGDFFGSGVGLNPFQDFYRSVTADGTLKCRWIMPYGTKANMAIVNLGKQDVEIQLKAVAEEQAWSEASMYFHTNWRQEYPISTHDHIDWNYIEVQGKGVYVGDTLSVMNPAARWWGEGDEKIYVDGESFPSQFGTGTEDYYGYAWGGRSNELFERPFHAQVRCGPKTLGHNTLTRTRALDAIPFQKSLKFDMEVWHWIRGLNLAYAVATYWYARPGSIGNHGPNPQEASRAIPQPPQQ